MRGAKVTLEPMQLADAVELCVYMREADREELRASSGEDPMDVMNYALRLSYAPGAARGNDGKLWCCFGVVPYGTTLSDTGIVWMLGTNQLDRHGHWLTAQTIDYLNFVRLRFPKLLNWVDVRNQKSVKWLRLLGFQMDEPQPYGIAGLPFHRFHMGL